jgi:hypothetical protein
MVLGSSSLTLKAAVLSDTLKGTGDRVSACLKVKVTLSVSH